MIRACHAGSLAAFAVCVSLLAGNAEAMGRGRSCRLVEPWFSAKQAVHRTRHESAELRLAAITREQLVREEVTASIFESYLARNLDAATLERCIANEPDRGNFLDTLQAVFYQKSIERLRTLANPDIQRLLGRIDERSGGGRLPIFRLTGHFQEQSPTQLKAGFERGTGSIFVDFSRVPANEWFIILIHELEHAVDETILEATILYSDSDTVKSIAEEARALSDPSLLAREDRARLDQWLHAGLDRGLLAEYRAWVPTFAIYESAMGPLWGRISWLDTVLEQRRRDEGVERFTYRFLDANSPDPTDGMFALPLVREELGRIRRMLAASL